MHVLKSQFRVAMLAPALLFTQQVSGQPRGIEFKAQLLLQQPGGKTGVKQEEFSKQARPGPDKELHLRVYPDQDCIASVAASRAMGNWFMACRKSSICPPT